MRQVPGLVAAVGAAVVGALEFNVPPGLGVQLETIFNGVYLVLDFGGHIAIGLVLLVLLLDLDHQQVGLCLEPIQHD